jgi:hypothetical protein
MGNPNPREEEELVITDFVYAAGTGKSWSDIAIIADFVFTAGNGKPWSDIADIANIPKTGAVNPIAGA